EPLGLAVRPGRIGAGPEMPQAQPRAGRAKQAGDIATAVVAHHAARRDAARGKPPHGPLDKRRTRGAELVGEDFDVRDATVVIDGDVDIFPADPAGPVPAVAMD